MANFISFSGSIGEKIRRNYVVTTHAITSAQTGATSPTFLGFRPDDLVVGNFGLAQFATDVPVSFVTN